MLSDVFNVEPPLCCVIMRFPTVLMRLISIEMKQILSAKGYSLGQGRAIARPQHARAYSMSTLSQYKPQLLYIPHALVPNTAQTTIKAEPTARNNTPHLIYLYQDMVAVVNQLFLQQKQ